MPEYSKVPAMPNPKPRSRSSRKLLAFLLVFFIVVLVVLFFQSSLSQVSEVQIEGNELLAADVIAQAAAVRAGDSFFAASSSAVEARISKLNIVQSVKVTKRFPGLIHIEVKEYPKVAFQMTPEGTKAAVLADGAVVTLHSDDVPLDKPILTGWSDTDPNKAALCRVLAELPAGSLADISEIKPDPSESYPDKIKLYTRSQFEVYTTIAYLAQKIDNLPAYIAGLQENHVTNGIIRMLEVDNHAPFEASEGDAGSDRLTDSTTAETASADKAGKAVSGGKAAGAESGGKAAGGQETGGKPGSGKSTNGAAAEGETPARKDTP